MKNYIKLLPAIMVIFNYGYSAQPVQVQQSGVGTTQNAQVNPITQLGALQTIGQNQTSNVTGSLPGTSSTTTVNPVQPNNTNQQNLVQQRSNSMTTIQNNNIQQVQSNNMQYAKSKTMPSPSNSAKILNAQQPIPTAPMDNSTSVPTVNQQPQKLHKANTIQKNAVVQNNQNVAPIKKTNTFTSTSNSSQVLGNITQQINRQNTINKNSPEDVQKLTMGALAVNTEQQYREKIKSWQAQQVMTTQQQAELGVVDTAATTRAWDAINNYSTNLINNRNNVFTLTDAKIQTLINLYNTFENTIKALEQSFTNIGKSNTNNNTINFLQTFGTDILRNLLPLYYKNKLDKLSNNKFDTQDEQNNQSQLSDSEKQERYNINLPNDLYKSLININNSNLLKSLENAIEHKQKSKKAKKEQKTIYILQSFLQWFRQLPQDNVTSFINGIEHYCAMFPSQPVK